MGTGNPIAFRIDRDSVHPGDDLVSHAITIDIAPSATFSDLLKKIRRINFLPRIVGGDATWVIDGALRGAIGVFAQQWQEPKLIVSPETTVSQLAVGGAGLYFRYWRQVNPDVVFSSIQAGRELPSK